MITFVEFLISCTSSHLRLSHDETDNLTSNGKVMEEIPKPKFRTVERPRILKGSLGKASGQKIRIKVLS